MDFLNRLANLAREQSHHAVEIIQNPKVQTGVAAQGVVVSVTDVPVAYLNTIIQYASLTLIIVSIIVAMPKLIDTLKQFYRWVRR